MKIINLGSNSSNEEFLTEQEATALFDSNGAANTAIANHLAATNPHQITPEAIGAASEFYAENLAQDAINASQAHTDGSIATHLAVTNPHQITPNLIGAAAASHTHTLASLKAAAASHAHAENNHIILPYRMVNLTTQTRINFNFSLLDTKWCGYLLNCVVGGHRGGFGGFLCKREIFLDRTTSSLNFEIISSLDRGNFSGIFAFSTTPTSIKITINNMSSTQRQDFGIYCEIVGSGADLAYPVISEINYA